MRVAFPLFFVLIPSGECFLRRLQKFRPVGTQISSKQYLSTDGTKFGRENNWLLNLFKSQLFIVGTVLYL